MEDLFIKERIERIIGSFMLLDQRTKYAIAAVLAILIIAAISILLFYHPSNSAQPQKGAINNPYGISQGYVGPGYYNIYGQSLYFSNATQLRLAAGSGYNTTQRNTTQATSISINTTTTVAPQSNSSKNSSAARFLSDITRYQSSPDLMILYSVNVSSATHGNSKGYAALYLLGKEAKFQIGGVYIPTNPQAFQEYTEVAENGSLYQCFPSTTGQSCINPPSIPGGYLDLDQYGILMNQSQLSTLAIIHRSSEFLYSGTNASAGRQCDMFYIQNATESYEICIDQATGYPLIETESTSINGTSVGGTIVAQNVSDNVSASEFYLPLINRTNTSKSSAPSGGPGNYFMSQSEALSLFGSGGAYSSSPLSQIQIGKYPYNMSILSGYQMNYDIALQNYSGIQAKETILISSSPQSVYKYLMSEYAPVVFNAAALETSVTGDGVLANQNVHVVLNSSTGGMVYSYANFSDTPGQVGFIIGTKGDAVVIASVSKPNSPFTINVAGIAGIVSADLP